jgi:hypothetical protein
MSDYTRQNDFSVKDALSSGDAAKLIKGSDMDAELDAIRTAVNSKADSPVPVASGGTGATSLTDGGILLGSGTGAVTAMAALGAGIIVVGDGTTDPSTESLAGTARTWTAAQRGTVTDIGSQASTVTVNLDTSNNHKVTLTGNAAFASPTGLDSDAIGQCGSIFITQDGTGSRAPTFNAAFDFVGGTAPTLTTTAAAVDRLDYIVVSATRLQCVATLAYS